jgi:hypothetical protein
MAWEDTNRDHIELLIQNEDWVTARNCLKAYIRLRGEDYWAKNMLKLVEDHLKD